MSGNTHDPLRPIAGVSSFTRRIRSLTLASAATCAIAAPSAQAQEEGAGVQNLALEEIVVTATRREKNLTDVPLSVQAVSGEQLEKLNAVNFADYARTIAGVSFLDSGPGRSQIFIRGVSTGGDVDTGKEATVAVYIDETPITEGSAQPDLKLYDIHHVEVLRGPQGTLFGSASLGGAVRVITNQPNLGKTEGFVQANGSYTDGGGGNGALNAMVNVPLSDKTALRVVGYGLQNSGFLDNGFSGKEDINTEDTFGGRVALRVRPLDELDIILTGMHQSSEIGAYNQVTDHFPDLIIDQSAAEPFDDELNIGSLKVQYDFSFATLTSATSYFDRHRFLGNDIDYFAEATFGIPRAFSPLNYDVKSFSEELRLTSTGEGRLNWIVGAFFLNRNDDFDQSINPVGSPPANQAADNFYFASTASDTRQIAAFGEAGFRLTPEITLTGGVRVSEIKRETFAVKDGFVIDLLFGGRSELKGDFTETPVTPKFNLSYEPTDNTLLYAQATKGFRIGGVNPGLPPCSASPGCTVDVEDTFSSDSLWNYEIGAKLQLFDRALSINAAVYDIEWSDIQLNLNRGDGFNGFRNAGNARIKGAEFEVSARVGRHLQTGGQLSYTDGKLTAIDAGVNAQVGDRLPDVAKWNGALYAELGTDFGTDGWAYVRADASYVGEREGVLGATPLPTLSAYTLLGMSLGINKGPYTASLFGTNLTDKRASLSQSLITGVRDGAPITFDRRTINRPRTIGVSMSRKF